MESHQLRYVLIMVCFVVTVIALAIALLTGAQNPEIITALITAASIFGPALVDAHAVEMRRRDPDQEPVADNVTRVSKA